MRIPRIYHPTSSLSIGQTVELSAEAANHVGRVLRMQVDQALELFCGDGHNYPAVIMQADKRKVVVQIKAQRSNPSESNVKIHLGQAISRGDRMDFVLQKSVELGVTEITPLFTERCGVKLSGERLLKKTEQWQKIVISACEQSGRSHVPVVHPALSLEHWLQKLPQALRLTLDPGAATPLAQQQVTAEQIQLVIGPEGGFSEPEVALTTTYNFHPIRLGPRVLRTETAALAALTVLQYQFGDLS